MSGAVYPVVLSGGTGLRLWPLSTSDQPKQFVKLFGRYSCFQQTLLRLGKVPGLQKPVIVTGAKHQSEIESQLEEIGTEATLLMEPEPRDSGPAIAAASAMVATMDKKAILLILAADHLIEDEPAFVDAVLTGLQVAKEGLLATFGIVPTSPETGYGYIAPGAPLERVSNARSVETFKEKPNSDVAKQFVESGYLWNSGNFAGPVALVTEEFARFEPDVMSAAAKAVREANRSDDRIWLDEPSFKAAPKISFDHAIMERTGFAAVVPSEMGWTDIGSWESVWRVSEKTDQGNALTGPVTQTGSSGNLIMSDSIQVIANGVHDLAIVVTKDGVLVSPLNRSQEIKALVAQQKALIAEEESKDA